MVSVACWHVWWCNASCMCQQLAHSLQLIQAYCKIKIIKEKKTNGWVNKYIEANVNEGFHVIGLHIKHAYTAYMILII